MFKRSVQLSVAISILSSGFTVYGQSRHAGHPYSSKIKSERALRETLKDVRKMLGMPSPPPSRPIDVSMSLDPSLLAAAETEQCLISICGPARTNHSSIDVYLDRTLKPSLSAQKTWDDRFDAKLKQNLKLQHEAALRLLQIQKTEIQRGVSINEKIPMRAVVGFMAALLESSEKMGNFVSMAPDQSGMIENTAQVEAYLRTIPEGKREAARLAIRKFYLPLVQMNFLGMGGNPLAARLKKLYENQNPKEALMRDSRKLLAEIDRVRKTVGGMMVHLMSESVSFDTLERASKGQDLSASESQSYMGSAMTIEMLGTIFDGGHNYQMLMRYPIDFEALRKKTIENGTVDQSLTALKTANLEDIALQIGNVCRKQLTASLDLGASDLRIARGKILIQQIKEAAKTVVRRFNSDAVLQVMTEEKIDQIVFAMPETNRDKIARLENVLQSQRRSAETFLSENWDNQEGREAILMFSLLGAMGSKMDGINVSAEESELKKACEALPVSTLSDFSMTSLGNVSVSWFTLNYPTVGAGIVAHEIGHVVSRILRTQRKAPVSGDVFTESLNCVANRNPNQNFPVRLFGFQDTVWSEEDWADYFSSLVIMEMEKTGTLSARTKNMACSLVMDLGDYYSITQGIAPAPNDSHSSGLLRVLMTAVDKGEMTPQCQKLVDRFPTKNSPLSCH